MLKKDLVAQCREFGLFTSGNKSDLIKRLEDLEKLVENQTDDIAPDTAGDLSPRSDVSLDNSEVATAVLRLAKKSKPKAKRDVNDNLKKNKKQGGNVEDYGVQKSVFDINTGEQDEQDSVANASSNSNDKNASIDALVFSDREELEEGVANLKLGDSETKKTVSETLCKKVHNGENECYRKSFSLDELKNIANGDLEELNDSCFEDLEELLHGVNKDVGRSKRIESKSDEKIDIRKFIAGKRFLICDCENLENDEHWQKAKAINDSIEDDCECEAYIDFTKDLGGVIKNINVGYSMSEYEVDFDQKTGWIKKTPNEILLTIYSTSEEKTSGEMRLKSSRRVELVKGKKQLSLDMVGTIELSSIEEQDLSSEQELRNIIKHVKLMATEVCETGESEEDNED